MRRSVLARAVDLDPMVPWLLSITLGDEVPDGVVHRFLAVPAAASPRLLLRSDRHRAGARAAWRQVSSTSWRSSVRRAALTGALLAGAARVAPGRVVTWRASPGPETVAARIADLVGRPVELVAVSLGPVRANRKPVLQLADRHGRDVAWAKLGRDPLTARLVERERVALAEVGPALGGVHVPRLLGGGSWGGVQVLVTAPLPARSSRALARATLVETVRAVHGTAGSTAQVAPRLGDLVRHPRLADLAQLAARVDGTRHQLRLGAWHGDLHAGNLGAARDGRAILWDWERWEAGVPLGADLLHHDLQSWVVAGRMPRAAAAEALVRRAPEILGPLGVGAAAAERVVVDYLVRLAARYVEDRQPESGAAVGAVEQWIFPALRGALSER
ncbi:hypothetical protein [Actinotalea sp.]|uniref:hypothetical protein n=1 Tax=Actinotalea sp. TaxID=1872145 RepID=UPI002C27FF14|nr:hypothetical protein [Actinotalea sp.]HRA49957.1 hypothetical protein [Actinotalea sp.]